MYIKTLYNSYRVLFFFAQSSTKALISTFDIRTHPGRILKIVPFF